MLLAHERASATSTRTQNSAVRAVYSYEYCTRTARSALSYRKLCTSTSKNYKLGRDPAAGVRPLLSSFTFERVRREHENEDFYPHCTKPTLHCLHCTVLHLSCTSTRGMSMGWKFSSRAEEASKMHLPAPCLHSRRCGRSPRTKAHCTTSRSFGRMGNETACFRAVKNQLRFSSYAPRTFFNLLQVNERRAPMKTA